MSQVDLNQSLSGFLSSFSSVELDAFYNVFSQLNEGSSGIQKCNSKIADITKEIRLINKERKKIGNQLNELQGLILIIESNLKKTNSANLTVGKLLHLLLSLLAEDLKYMLASTSPQELLDEKASWVRRLKLKEAVSTLVDSIHKEVDHG